MSSPILSRFALYLAVLSCLAAGARADQVSPYPCSPKYVAAADFCAEIWAKTKDSAWMVFDVEFKKPAPESLDTESAKAKLMQYNGMFFNAYQIRSKDDTTKTLPMPMGAAQKWAYEGLIFRRYYANTVSMDDIVAKMAFKPGAASGVRSTPPWHRGKAAGGKAFTLDGREVVAPKAQKGSKAKSVAPSVAR